MSVTPLREHGSDSPAGLGSELLPPQDVPAEQSVLGAMLLSKDAIADVVETIREHDFYLPSHASVYAAILDLYGRGEPADAVTVAAELTRTGDIGRVGGAPYLHTLVASVPTAANADYYARIVRERAILRRLVEAGTRITQLAYAQEGDVDGIVDRAQAAVYDVTDKRASEDYLSLKEILPGTLEEIEAIANRGGQMTGVPTGFHDLDARMMGMHPGQMIVVAARPGVGKSTIGLDFARSCSIKHGLTSAIFSLEMSRQEITMRLLSAEAGIGLGHLRGGSMADKDWEKLARHMSRVSEAPLFIDDSPNLTMMEIRAKARRLRQRHDLRLIVIDYLQLMTSGKKVESRQQEVSEFSRSIKLLAKELDIPVIAISQLNRGPEQRTDKKPMISDLRESGCLTAETRILRADTGAETTMGELHATGARDIEVWALDDSLRYVRSTLTHVFPTGRREVFRLRLASGKTIRATANHPFLTYEGWRALGDLAPGVRLAVPRHVCAPRQQQPWSQERLRSAAWAGAISDDVAALPKEQVAAYLRELWTRHGLVRSSGLVRLSWPTRDLLDGVSRLLLRFGISCVIAGADGAYVLDIAGIDDQRRFLGEIGIAGADAGAAEELLANVRARSSYGPVSTGQVWHQVGVLLDAPASNPAALGRVAAVLDDAELDLMATNDVLWDEIVEIAPDGVEDVYDATVLGRHNFIADGIAVHNSIEQDADVVLLLHREDLYERESPRAGEADIILAKHRNGPTDTITVAFQGHYSRFVDMAQG